MQIMTPTYDSEILRLVLPILNSIFVLLEQARVKIAVHITHISARARFFHTTTPVVLKLFKQ